MQTIVGISLSPCLYTAIDVHIFHYWTNSAIQSSLFFYLIRDISGIRHTLLFCQEYGYTV